MTDLTDAQREARRTRARNLIEERLAETWPAWRRPGRKPNLALAADIALDSLGDLAAEILVDGTMMRALTIKNGVATLELAEATEMVRIFAAGMRGVLDGHGASNYVEMEMTDGSTGQGYTVTIQRRSGTTPHQFRQQAEAKVAELQEAMRQIRHLHKDSPMGPCPVCFDGDGHAAGGDGLVPYPCPTARLAGAQDRNPTPREALHG
ncbi:hypothetical protein [Streptomyces sp. NBC_01435]|uniref:hypothetical protein n=1 Tax=Streptomyces sp. NBC_01435 TaxID=2903865 RepID=UPI002E379ABB|nr:hypothetical protein [Streptomyces sp. NBC_01435]